MEVDPPFPPESNWLPACRKTCEVAGRLHKRFIICCLMKARGRLFHTDSFLFAMRCAYWLLGDISVQAGVCTPEEYGNAERMLEWQ